MSAPGVPSVTVVHPTTAIRPAATQPAARAAPAQPGHPIDPIRTGYDVTGYRPRPPCMGTTRGATPCGTIGATPTRAAAPTQTEDVHPRRLDQPQADQPSNKE